MEMDMEMMLDMMNVNDDYEDGDEEDDKEEDQLVDGADWFITSQSSDSEWSRGVTYIFFSMYSWPCLIGASSWMFIFVVLYVGEIPSFDKLL